MTTRVDYGDVMVCEDCYFAHHFGAHEHEREATDREAAYYLGGHGGDREFMGIEWVETDAGLMVKEWFAGESDQRCEGGEPLLELDGFEVSDNTDSETGEGIDTFSWQSCEGCGSHLGGSRYRLHLWKVERDD